MVLLKFKNVVDWFSIPQFIHSLGREEKLVEQKFERYQLYKAKINTISPENYSRI